MKSSDLLLLFFIIYSSILTILLISEYYTFIKKLNKIDKYNEELHFELVKLRKKCYSKNKEE